MSKILCLRYQNIVFTNAPEKADYSVDAQGYLAHLPDHPSAAVVGSVLTYVQILGLRKRSWYEGDRQYQPCVP